MSSDHHRHITTSGRATPVTRSLYHATLARSEPFNAIPAAVLSSAKNSHLVAERVAAELYEASVALQNLDREGFTRALESTTGLLNYVEDPHLHWWYHQTHAEVASSRGDLETMIAEYERAIAITQTHLGFEREAERSFANLLYHLQRVDDGNAVAETLLRFLRCKPTTELGPYFYLIATDALFWLGEYEYAYALRSRASQAQPRPLNGSVARDERELARYLIAMGRLEEARAHLDAAMDWIPNSTAEQAALTHTLAAEFFAAQGDLETAIGHLASVRSLNSYSQLTAAAAFPIVKALQERGDFERSAALLDDVDVEDVAPSLRPIFYELSGEALYHRGELAAAIDSVERARRVRSWQRPSAGTIATIRNELTPWMAVATADHHEFSPVEPHRAFRSQWLLSTAAEMYRCVEAANQIFNDESTSAGGLQAMSTAVHDTQVETLTRITDDLTMISEFLAESGRGIQQHEEVSFWRTHDVAERIVARAGAELSCSPRPGTPLGLPDEGLAGRLAFGLVVMVADSAREGVEIRLTVDGQRLEVKASGLDELAVSRVVRDLQYLRTPVPPTSSPIPQRPALVAAVHGAIQRGWTSRHEVVGPDALAITIETNTSRCGDHPTSATTQQVTSKQRPQLPDGDPELVATIRSLHEHRYEGLRLDPTFLDRTRATGNVALHASALLAAAGTLCFEWDHLGADAALEELWALVADDPSLAERSWPGPLYFANRDAIVSASKGELKRKWRSVAWGVTVSVDANEVSQVLYDDIFVLTVCEVDRGDLVSAWQIGALCDPLGTSIIGRSRELATRVMVLLAEEQWAEAEAIARERLELVRGTDMMHRQDALRDLARCLAQLGRFDEARGAISELSTSPGLIDAPRSFADLALISFLEGRDLDAFDACQKARADTPEDYNAVALSTTVPIEAELLLRSGHVDQARAVLLEFPIERHGLLDLPHRLHVEHKVAKACGDQQRLWEIVKQQLALEYGKPRFDATTEPLYQPLRRAIETVAARDRARLQRERAAVGSVVAHDLRNALSVITLVLDIARVKPESVDLSRAQKALEPIRTLAQQLEDVALTGSLDATASEEMELTSLIDVVASPIRAAYERKGGTLNVRTESIRGVLVRTRASLLEVVLRNLIGNAAKHGRPAGTIDVHTDYTAAGDTVGYRSFMTITVDDDGPGLSAAQRHRFNDPDLEAVASDRGLGLGIIRRYVAALGFIIRADESPAGGARFVLTIYVGEQSGATGSQPGRALDSATLSSN